MGGIPSSSLIWKNNHPLRIDLLFQVKISYMLNINEADLIGKGAHRLCYKHPENKSLCIKVVVRGHDCALEIEREKKYYRHLQKRGISWDMIPRYYGDIETSLGRGSVFDLIFDEDCSVSKSLEYYLSSERRTEQYYECLAHSLVALKNYLLQNRIITMNIKPYNILCQKMTSGIARLFVIDNIYNSEFIPVSTYLGFFAKRKISRKWQRFEHSLLNLYRNNKVLYRMLNHS